MSKKYTFGAAKTTAFAELVRVLGLLDYTKSLKTLSIDEGRSGATDGTVRFNVTGEDRYYVLKGEVVVKKYGDRWHLYCAASYFNYQDTEHTFWFDPETETSGVRFNGLTNAGEEHHFQTRTVKEVRHFA